MKTLPWLARARDAARAFVSRARHFAQLLGTRPRSAAPRRARWGLGLGLGALLVTLWSCCPARPPTGEQARDATSGGERTEGQRRGAVLRGDASYYANFFRGRKTANGERYDPRKFTAANRTLPLGTRLRVTRVDNGKSVVVRVNDRGPFGRRSRILDLSRAAAEQLDMIRVGHAQVEAVILE
jgi:rare lipoprotein A